MKKLMIALAALAVTAHVLAMPTREELSKAQPLVNELMSPTLEEYKSAADKTAAAISVGERSCAFAAEAETEAAKFLLLKGALSYYVRGEAYDKAADCIATMQANIGSLAPDVVAEIVGKATSKISESKAPRLLAYYRAAKLQVRARKELPVLEKKLKRAKSEPLQRQYAEALAISGNWKAAYDAFAKSRDKELARIAEAEAKGTAVNEQAAELWWNYKPEFEGAENFFKVHAVEFYQRALEKGEIVGLKKTIVERRIAQVGEEASAHAVAKAAGASCVGDCKSAGQDAPSSSSASREGGAPVASAKAPDAKAERLMKIQVGGRLDLEFLPCPAGTFTMGSAPDGLWKAHRVTISRSFWMSKFPVTYAQAMAITGKARTEENQWGDPPFPWNALGGDKTPAGMSPRQALGLLETMNEKYASRLPKGYVFRFPTEAEWEYAFKGGKEKYWDDATFKRRAIFVEERQKAMEGKGLKVKNFEKFPWVLPYVPVGTKEPNEWGFYDLLGNGWTYLLDTVEGDHSERMLDIGADDILAGLYKDGDTDPVPQYEGKGKRIVMRGSGWGDAKFKGQRYKKVLFPCADVFHHDGHVRLVIGPDLIAEKMAKDGKK